MLMNLLCEVFRKSSHVIETSKQCSLTAWVCYWKVETAKRTKIGTVICTLKLVYEASQGVAENSVHIFKKLRCGVLLLLTRIICLTRTAGRDIENLIKIDWNCLKVERFVGIVCSQTLLATSENHWYVAFICLHVTFDDFSRWEFLIFLISADF